MPLPVLHSYTGYQIYKLSLDKGEVKSWKLAALFMFLANLADLDMIPGMLTGNPEAFHRSITHSLGAALISACVVAGAGKLTRRFSFMKLFLVSLNAYFSHIVLDYISGSVRFMLWPFKVTVAPLSITALFQQHHAHSFLHCEGWQQFCQILFNPSLTLRLLAEGVLVYLLISVPKLFSKTRHVQPGISDSPSLVAGLTLFLFVVTALLATQAAG